MQGPPRSGRGDPAGVRWYLRYPLAFLHLSEILTERGLFMDASCIGGGCRHTHPNWTNAVVNVDKNPAYTAAVEAVKTEGALPRGVRLRQCKYLNNIIEQDHRTVKKRVNQKGTGAALTGRATRLRRSRRE
jgi:transposase-like protein